MSTDAVDLSIDVGRGAPELSAVGKRIEVLRIARGLSKQQLARGAGTSRQQLWRVITGKSELTSSLGYRLAEVLAVDSRVFQVPSDTPLDAVLGSPATTTTSATLPAATLSPAPAPRSIAEYLQDAAAIAATLATLPDDPSGRRLRRSLLNAIEDLAAAEGIRLPAEIFELRSRVLHGEI